MKHTAMLRVASLLSVLLFTFHVADDIARGMESGTVSNLAAVPICVAWLYGTLVLAERWSGHVIMLVGGLLGMAVPVLHMMGSGVGPIARAGGALFFIWTLLALGVSALFSFILSARGLWSLTLGRSRWSRPDDVGLRGTR